MHRLLFVCLAALSSAGMASAQEIVANAKAAPASGAALHGIANAATGTHHSHAAADCPPGCAVKKTCVVVPDVKKTSKTVYSSREKDFCLPKTKCSGCCRRDCDQSCDQGGCEHCVRTKRVLLKKTVTTECPSFKCVVAEEAVACAPSCGPKCGPRPGCSAGCVRGGGCRRSTGCDTVVPAATPGQKMPPANPGALSAPVPPSAVSSFPVVQLLPTGSTR